MSVISSLGRSDPPVADNPAPVVVGGWQTAIDANRDGKDLPSHSVLLAKRAEPDAAGDAKRNKPKAEVDTTPIERPPFPDAIKGPLTLQDAVDRAATVDPRVISQRIVVVGAERTARISKGGALSGSASIAGDPQSVLNDNFGTIKAALTLGIFAPAVGAQKNLSVEQLALQKVTGINVRATAAVETAQLYQNIQDTIQKRETNTLRLAALSETSKALAAQDRNQSTNTANINATNASLSTEKTTTNQLQSDLDSRLLQLRDITNTTFTDKNIPGHLSVIKDDPLLHLTPQDIQQKVLLNNPAIIVAQQAIAVADKQLELARAQQKPNVSVNLLSVLGLIPLVGPFVEKAAGTVLNFNGSVSNTGGTRISVGAAKNGIDAARDFVNRQKDQYALEAKTLVVDVNRLKAQLDDTNDEINKNKDAYNFVTNQFKNQSGEIFGVQGAYSNLLNSIDKFGSTYTQYARDLSRLKYLTGALNEPKDIQEFGRSFGKADNVKALGVSGYTYPVFKKATTDK